MQKESSVNKGINAKNISAEVIAVGDHARAVKTNYGAIDPKINQAISEFHDAIRTLNLTKDAEKVIENDIDQLKATFQKNKINKDKIEGILKSIADKLKMVGIVISETNNLVEPLKKIGASVGLALSFLSI